MLSSVATFPLWSPSTSSPAPAEGAADGRAASAVSPDLTVLEPALAPLPAEPVTGIPAPSTPPDIAVIDAFDSWLLDWNGASAEAREAMLEDGVERAAARRPVMKALIALNPRLALERAVSRITRQDLPQEITALLEAPVSAQGEFGVKITCDCQMDLSAGDGHEPGHHSRTERFFTVGGFTYNARVSGDLESLTSRKTAPLQGVAIDGEMAVAANAVRRIEPGERLPAGAVIEPHGAGDTANPHVVEIAGRWIAVGSDEEVAALEDDFNGWVHFEYGGSNSAGFFHENFPNPAAKKIGNYRLLYVRVNFPDIIATNHSEESAEAQARELERIYGEWSYGKLVCTTTVTPVVTMPWSRASGFEDLSPYVQDSVRKLGYDPDQYDTVVICADGFRGVAFWNTAIVGGSLNTILHEVGHRLGAWHSGFWGAVDGTGYGYPGPTLDTYGNIFDIMGNYGISGERAHFSAMNKIMLGWLAPGDIHRVKSNGVYRIHAFDQPLLENGKRYALVAAKDRFHNYYLEYRPSIGGLVADSALVLTGDEKSEPRLVDTTPHTVASSDAVKHDSGIAVGRTFSDLEADLHFTVIAKNATTPPSLDIVCQRGPFPGNQAPVLAAIVPSATDIAAGGSITFDASAAADADGDALAYHWDFGDGVSMPSSAVVSRTFPSAAQVTAMVTVSDMKGGTVRRHVVVNVGNHGKQTITGTITLAGQPLENVYVTAPGGRYAFTDRSGNYALSNLGTGSTTLAATFNGHTLAPSFANPLNVAAGANVADWTANASWTFVTLGRIADASEGGANGTFRITRTGSTASALVVRVAEPGASAAVGSDYTLTPDRTVDGSGKYWNFTIPAGQASLDVSVAAVNDSLAEGPEALRLHLSLNGSYLPGSAGALVMTLHDNDTTLPRVAVVAGDPCAAEFPADPGSFTFSRTGSTAAALEIPVAWSGTATNGTDFAALPAVVTIPAGQASVSLTLSPSNDSDIESTETVIATVQASPGHVIDSSGSTATIEVTDDDVPVVTVSVPDASASESGPDSGLFLIHRSGSTAAPLKVYYGVRGSALHGADYASLPGEVVIPAGARSAPVLISPVDDGASETSETVVLALASVSNAYSMGAEFRGTVTISDNEGLPVICVRPGVIGTEGGANATVTFRSTGSGSGNVTVHYTVSGTATSGADFTALPGSLVIPAHGLNDVTIAIPILNDAVAEATERVVITLVPDGAYLIEHGGAADALIRDNDSGGERVNAAVANFAGPSEAGPVSGRFHFSRTNTAADLVVNYGLSGTATNGVDYVNLPGTVTIPAGQTGVFVDVVPINDTVAEGVETVTLTVLPGGGYSPEALGADTLEISDNELLATTVGFQAGHTLASELPGSNGEFRDIEVRLSAASASPVTVEVVGANGSSAHGNNVDWAFADATDNNATLPTATLAFPPGEISRQVRIRVKNDGMAEPIEVIALRLHSPRGASLSPTGSQHQVFLFDGAVPPVPTLVTEERWNNASVYTNNTWNTGAPDYTGLVAGFTPRQNTGDNFSRRLTGLVTAPATGSYTFWIASDDGSKLFISTDATAANKVQRAHVSGWTGYQNWMSNPSQQSAPLNLVAGQSYYVEVQHQEAGGDDHVSVAWEGPGFSRTEVLAPMPDDAARTVRFAQETSTRVEADGAEPGLVVFLDRPAGPGGVAVNLTVDGSASVGSDFTLASNSVVFAPGESTRNVPLAVIADGLAEGPEWLRVSLASPAGAQVAAPSAHTMILLDAPAPVVGSIFTVAHSTMAAGTDLGELVATPAPGLGIAGWAIVAGNSGNAFAISPAGRLTLATPGALPSPGGVQLVVRATDTAGSTGEGVVNVVCNGPAHGVVEQRWAGSHPFDLNNWSGLPSYSGTLANFTTGQNAGDGYSRRLTGYLKPVVSGDYTFWVAGDDQCRLYLGDGASPSSMKQIAAVGGWTAFQQWDGDQSSTFPRQMSAVIPLVAGKVYRLEAHHREDTGGDHVSVAWKRAGGVREEIPAGVIFPALPGPDFDAPPVPPVIVLGSPGTGSQFESGSDITLAADVAGGSIPVTAVEFHSGSTLIESDSSAPYSVTWPGASAGTHVITAKAVYAGGSVTSAGVELLVTDPDPAADPDGDGFTTGLELVLGTGPYSAASQPPSVYAGLLGWWKLDDGAGTLADDSTGLALDGTVAGATWVPGVSGSALRFDGVNDSVSMPTGLLGNRSSFTTSGWYRTSKSSGNRVGLWGQNDGVEFGINGTKLSLWTPNGGSAETQLPARNAWHHVACVGDGTSLKIYVDGALAATGGSTTSSYGNSTSPFRIGGGGIWDASGNHFDGRIDDVRIYNRALSAAEVGALRGTPVFEADSLLLMASENLPAQGQLLVENASIALPMAFSKVSGPEWLNLAADGVLSGTPDMSGVGRSVAVVKVVGAGGYSAEGNLAVIVNAAPRFLSAEFEMPAAAPGSPYAGTLAGSAYDRDGDAVTFAKLSGPGWLTVAADGSLSGQPEAADAGENQFVVQVADVHGASSLGLVLIRVGGSQSFPEYQYGSLAGTNTSDEFIQRVRIADLDHESGNNGGYADFRSHVARIDPGQTIGYTLTPGWTGTLYAEAWSVWIDLNRDGDFGDAGERVLQLAGANTERTGTFTLPATASHGLTHMRIAMKYASAPAEPTGTFTWGEVEDYSVQVGAPRQPNAAPYFLVDPLVLKPADTLAGLAADWENHPLVFGKVSGPEWLQVSPTGELSGTPPDDGSGEFVVSVTDSLGDKDTALLRIVMEPQGFSGWASDKGLEGESAGFDADPDGDGLANGLEFVLCGEPHPAHPDANSATLLQVAADDDGDLVFTFQRWKAAVGAVQLHFQWSADLDFAAMEADIPVLAGDSITDGIKVDVTAGSPDAETDVVRITVPADRAVDGRLFGRLNATPVP